MPKFSLLICGFPFGQSEHPDVTKWLIHTIPMLKQHPYLDRVDYIDIDDTPITMSRNLCLKHALDNDYDFVLMIDSDMTPDAYAGHPKYPEARPFLPDALNFLLCHEGPACVGAPYCGKPPKENIFVFRWASSESDKPAVTDTNLVQFEREEVVNLTGIQEVAALPTGLFLMDMRALQALEPENEEERTGWFQYEWKDNYETAKATTEDVYFTRNLSLAGVPQYCDWNAWCFHNKNKKVGKPHLLGPSHVAEHLRAVVRRSDAQSAAFKVIDKTPRVSPQMQAKSNATHIRKHDGDQRQRACKPR